MKWQCLLAGIVATGLFAWAPDAVAHGGFGGGGGGGHGGGGFHGGGALGGGLAGAVLVVYGPAVWGRLPAPPFFFPCCFFSSSFRFLSLPVMVGFGVSCLPLF